MKSTAKIHHQKERKKGNPPPEGRAVNIKGLMRFAPSIRGTFMEDGKWDSERNTLAINTSLRPLNGYKTRRVRESGCEDEEIKYITLS